MSSTGELTIENTVFSNLYTLYDWGGPVLEATLGDTGIHIQNVTIQNCDTSRGLVSLDSYADQHASAYINSLKILDNAVAFGNLIYVNGFHLDLFIDDLEVQGNRVQTSPELHDTAFYAAYSGSLR